LLQKIYAVSGPGVYYHPSGYESSDSGIATPASAAAPATTAVLVPQKEMKAANPLAKPEIKRQKSAHEDLQMPKVFFFCCLFCSFLIVCICLSRRVLIASKPSSDHSLLCITCHQMVRRVSEEEERVALQREEALKVNAARLTADGKCTCHKPKGLCVCLPYVAVAPAPKAVEAKANAEPKQQAKVNAEPKPQAKANAKPQPKPVEERRPTMAEAALAMAMATQEAAKAQEAQENKKQSKK
jgi:hypothetical protein